MNLYSLIYEYVYGYGECETLDIYHAGIVVAAFRKPKP